MAIQERILCRGAGQMIHSTDNETSPITGLLTDTPDTWYNLMSFIAPDDTPPAYAQGNQLRPKYADKTSAILEGGAVPASRTMYITHLNFEVGLGYTMAAGVVSATRDAHALALWRLVDIDETVSPRTTTAVEGFETVIPNSVFSVVSGPPPINFITAENALASSGTELPENQRSRIAEVFPLFSAFGSYPFHLAQDVTEPYTCVYWRWKIPELIDPNNPLSIPTGHILMLQGKIQSSYSDVGFEYDCDALGYLDDGL